LACRWPGSSSDATARPGIGKHSKHSLRLHVQMLLEETNHPSDMAPLEAIGTELRPF
jgi:hypothetical protein